MTDNRDQPQTVVQAVGGAAHDVIGGLKSQPMLLALVVMVMIGVALNYWFMRGLIEDQHTRSLAVMQSIEKLWTMCIRDDRRDSGYDPDRGPQRDGAAVLTLPITGD